MLWPTLALLPCGLKTPPRHAVAVRACAPLHDVFDYAAAESLAEDDGVLKTVLRAAPVAGDGTAPARPKWGALAEILFTGRFSNGTVFDEAHATESWEFQLNANVVVDGMERGVKSMRPGEVARIRCEPRWAYGQPGLGNRIPQNATLLYDVELVGWKDGPPIENDDFDLDTYRSALEGKEAGSGRTEAYRWSERGEEVIFWLPLREGEGARDIECEFRPRSIRIAIGGAAAVEAAASREGGVAAAAAAAVAAATDPPPPRTVVEGELKGRADTEDSYWVIEEEGEGGGRELQVVIAKQGEYVKWDGLLIGEEEGNGE